MQYLKKTDALFRPLFRLQASQIRPITVSSPYTPEEKKLIDQLLVPRKDPNAYYEGPERDLVNFPRPVQAEYSKLCRLKFIPDSWFQAFYTKTGVTGPYLLGIGLMNFMFSKEIIVMEHEFYQGLNLFILFYIFTKKFGPTIRAYLDDQAKEYMEEVNGKKDNLKNLYVQLATNEKDLQKQAGGQMMIYQAKKENILLQLEAEYRKRLNQVYSDVKVRLDYMVASVEAKRRMEQSHMVEWVISNALKSISAQHEKETMAKCFSDLKGLAAKY